MSSKRLWGLVGLTLFSIVSATVLFTKTTPLLAKTEDSAETSEINTPNQQLDSSITDSLGIQTQANDLGRALDPIENESGLKVTPKVLKLSQYDYFPDLNNEEDLKRLFSKRVIPHPDYGATYEYVDEGGYPTSFYSDQVGFQMIYVKVTENYDGTSVQVPIPVTVTDLGTSFLLKNQVALQIDNVNGKIILYPEETVNKTEEQLQQLVKEKSMVRAWNVENGTEVSANVIKTTISVTSVGTYKAEFEVTMGYGAEEQKASVQKTVIVFGANPKAYVTVAQYDTLEFDYPPKNLFSKFQTLDNGTGESATYQFVDENGNEIDTFDTTVVGFQWAYVKMTESNDESISTIIKVPINVTSEDTTALLKNKVMVKSDAKVLFYPDETQGKSKEEILEMIKYRVELSAWNMSTGEEIPASFVDTTTVNNSVGSYTGTIRVELNGESATTTRKVIVFGANSQPYVTIGQDEYLELIPTNLFKKIQTVNDESEANAYFEFVNENGEYIGNVDTQTVGFQWAYVKMTQVDDDNVSTIIQVPINVTSEDTTALLKNKVMVESDTQTLFFQHETKGKSKDELIDLVKSRVHANAWNMSTGEMVPASVTETTMVNNSVGTYTITIKVELDGEVETTTRQITVFGADLKSPYYAKVEQNELLDMGNNASNLFSKYQSETSNTADSAYFEWVNESGEPTEDGNFDSRQVGFQWGYIKMSEMYNDEISTIIPIPITVTFEKQTVIVESKAGLSFEKNRPFTPNEFKDKTDQEINEVLTKALSPKAWDLTSGEKLEARITQTMIDESSSGSVEVSAKVTLNNQQLTYNFKIYIIPAQIFEDDEIDSWTSIQLGSIEGVITNPINGSQMGFPKRGISTNSEEEAEHGFIIKDANNVGYVFSGGEGRVSDIPGVNNKALYNSGSEWSTWDGLGQAGITPHITFSYYLRKDNKLKQILLDEKNEILYVYDLSLNRNLNFSIHLNMYNMGDKAKKFSMLESVDTDYYTDSVPIYALENNSGFYMEPSSESRFSIKLKDSNGNWLSGYTKYIVGGYSSIGVAGSTNYFGNDFMKTGDESQNYAAGEVIISGVDSAYQLGAPWKNIAPKKALEAGYEVFAGDEIPYMQMKANPEVFTVYQDHNTDFDIKYKLSEIPYVGDRGTVYITYPNGKEVTMPFTANSNKEFNGKFKIPRAELPEKLNEEPGTIKSYKTGLLAINDTEGSYKGLPSQDYSITIKAYNLGAKPVPQIIQKGEEFKKKASELIQNAVILPGHTPSYEYEGDMPDTSVTGLTSVTVRMTDRDQPEKTTLIKVPIQVIDKTPPTSGLYLVANDFSSSGESFQELPESERDELILKKSEAIAWDIETGSMDKIKLSVESTTLPVNPAQGSYKATIKATKDTETIKKTITIDIQSNQKVNVEFVDETGESLHDKITFDKTIGTTIDLTKEKEVQKALETILAKNYQLVKKPDNETQIPVTSEESTVQYQFKGMLYIQSSPNFLNFGRKSLGLPFIKVEKAKYDKPLIVWDNRKNGGAWDLTATLKKPLTSQEDQSKILPSAIRYKVSDSETIILSENTTQSIAERTHESKGQYNVSNEWDKNETGLLLEVPSGEVLQAGGYRATILWQVQSTP
ncbi:hypothetical protein RU98_GL002538 [Enterococcus caccae]|nr:hypothetical protein RU98_GL002538 [Enterococcus caccae]